MSQGTPPPPPPNPGTAAASTSTLVPVFAGSDEDYKKEALALFEKTKAELLAKQVSSGVRIKHDVLVYQQWETRESTLAETIQLTTNMQKISVYTPSFLQTLWHPILGTVFEGGDKKAIQPLIDAWTNILAQHSESWEQSMLSYLYGLLYLDSLPDCPFPVGCLPFAYQCWKAGRIPSMSWIFLVTVTMGTTVWKLGLLRKENLPAGSSPSFTDSLEWKIGNKRLDRTFSGTEITVKLNADAKLAASLVAKAGPLFTSHNSDTNETWFKKSWSGQSPDSFGENLNTCLLQTCFLASRASSLTAFSPRPAFVITASATVDALAFNVFHQKIWNWPSADLLSAGYDISARGWIPTQNFRDIAVYNEWLWRQLSLTLTRLGRKEYITVLETMRVASEDGASLFLRVLNRAVRTWLKKADYIGDWASHRTAIALESLLTQTAQTISTSLIGNFSGEQVLLTSTPLLTQLNLLLEVQAAPRRTARAFYYPSADVPLWAVVSTEIKVFENLPAIINKSQTTALQSEEFQPFSNVTQTVSQTLNLAEQWGPRFIAWDKQSLPEADISASEIDAMYKSWFEKQDIHFKFRPVLPMPLEFPESLTVDTVWAPFPESLLNVVGYKDYFHISLPLIRDKLRLVVPESLMAGYLHCFLKSVELYLLNLNWMRLDSKWSMKKWPASVTVTDPNTLIGSNVTNPPNISDDLQEALFVLITNAYKHVVEQLRFQKELPLAFPFEDNFCPLTLVLRWPAVGSWLILAADRFSTPSLHYAFVKHLWALWVGDSTTAVALTTWVSKHPGSEMVLLSVFASNPDFWGSTMDAKSWEGFLDAGADWPELKQLESLNRPTDNVVPKAQGWYFPPLTLDPGGVPSQSPSTSLDETMLPVFKPLAEVPWYFQDVQARWIRQESNQLSGCVEIFGTWLSTFIAPGKTGDPLLAALSVGLTGAQKKQLFQVRYQFSKDYKLKVNDLHKAVDAAFDPLDVAQGFFGIWKCCQAIQIVSSKSSNVFCYMKHALNTADVQLHEQLVRNTGTDQDWEDGFSVRYLFRSFPLGSDSSTPDPPLLALTALMENLENALQNKVRLVIPVTNGLAAFGTGLDAKTVLPSSKGQVKKTNTRSPSSPSWVYSYAGAGTAPKAVGSLQTFVAQLGFEPARFASSAYGCVFVYYGTDSRSPLLQTAFQAHADVNTVPARTKRAITTVSGEPSDAKGKNALDMLTRILTDFGTDADTMELEVGVGLSTPATWSQSGNSIKLTIDSTVWDSWASIVDEIEVTTTAEQALKKLRKSPFWKEYVINLGPSSNHLLNYTFAEPRDNNLPQELQGVYNFLAHGSTKLRAAIESYINALAL